MSDKAALNYTDFKAFLVQYETLLPDLCEPSFLLSDRLSTLNELIKQNNELLAAAKLPDFIPTDLGKQTLSIKDVETVLVQSDELMRQMLNDLEAKSLYQYR